LYHSRGYGFDFDEIRERARWQEFVIWRFLVKIVHPVQQIAAADAPDTADDEDHGHDHGRPGRGKFDVFWKWRIMWTWTAEFTVKVPDK
jgi:hypothetical protein